MISKIKKNAKLYIFAIILNISLIGLVAFLLGFQFVNTAQSNKIELENNVAYEMRPNATEIQKVYFDELKETFSDVERTDFERSASIVKNFVADFYTWSNKRGSYDVGGLEFVYQLSILNIQEGAKNLFYKDLSYYIQQYGAENLPQVAEVTILSSDYETPLVIGDETFTSFYVVAEWSYVPNSVFDVSQLQTKGYFSVVNNNGRFELYRYYRE